MSGHANRYVQMADVRSCRRSIERKVFDTLADFLDYRGIDTKDRRQRASCILNNNVVVMQGGNINADNFASATRRRPATPAARDRRARGQAMTADGVRENKGVIMSGQAGIVARSLAVGDRASTGDRPGRIDGLGDLLTQIEAHRDELDDGARQLATGVEAQARAEQQRPSVLRALLEGLKQAAAIVEAVAKAAVLGALGS